VRVWDGAVVRSQPHPCLHSCLPEFFSASHTIFLHFLPVLTFPPCVPNPFTQCSQCISPSVSPSLSPALAWHCAVRRTRSET
jgi:hypothetical protein